MKKKILIVCLLIALVLVPASAASYKGASSKNTVGVGLNLGLNSGVGLKFGLGKFDIVGNVGLGVLELDLQVDAEVMYELYDFDLQKGNHLPLTGGFGLATNLDLQNIENSSLSVLGLLGIEWTIPNEPWNFYFRAGLGPKFVFNNSEKFVYVAGAANIGALYLFDL